MNELTFDQVVVFAVVAVCLTANAFPTEDSLEESAMAVPLDDQQAFVALPSDDMDTEATKWFHWYGHKDLNVDKWAKKAHYKVYKPFWYKKYHF